MSLKHQRKPCAWCTAEAFNAIDGLVQAGLWALKTLIIIFNFPIASVSDFVTHFTKSLCTVNWSVTNILTSNSNCSVVRQTGVILAEVCLWISLLFQSQSHVAYYYQGYYWKWVILGHISLYFALANSYYLPTYLNISALLQYYFSVT